ncbi:MAG: DUF4147 domain-containing protein, partial [Candidatus Acidiferrum sp.]
MAELKQLACQIFQETISAVDIPAAFQRKLQLAGGVLRFEQAEVDLGAFAKLRVIAIGKAAHGMMEGLADVLGGKFRLEGIVCAPTPPERAIEGMQYFIGGHPTPDAQSWRAAEAILESLKECDEKTAVFFLFSG